MTPPPAAVDGPGDASGRRSRGNISPPGASGNSPGLQGRSGAALGGTWVGPPAAARGGAGAPPPALSWVGIAGERLPARGGGRRGVRRAWAQAPFPAQKGKGGYSLLCAPGVGSGPRSGPGSAHCPLPPPQLLSPCALCARAFPGNFLEGQGRRERRPRGSRPGWVQCQTEQRPLGVAGCWGY